MGEIGVMSLKAMTRDLSIHGCRSTRLMSSPGKMTFNFRYRRSTRVGSGDRHQGRPLNGDNPPSGKARAALETHELPRSSAGRFVRRTQATGPRPARVAGQGVISLKATVELWVTV